MAVGGVDEGSATGVAAAAASALLLSPVVAPVVGGVLVQSGQVGGRGGTAVDDL